MKKRHTVIVGLGFGDEGKGKTVSYASHCVGASQVVRFNGGPQAAHHVVNESGDVHCFSQYGAGTLGGAETHLSRHMFVEPFALQKEAEALEALGLEVPLSRVWMAEGCHVVTPFHKMLNRMQEESRGEGRHGSCGMGVGQAFMDSQKPGYPVLVIGDCFDDEVLHSKLRMLWMLKCDIAEQLVIEHPGSELLASMWEELRGVGWVSYLVDAYGAFVRESGVHIVSDQTLAARWFGPARTTVWEGAQGVLLDAERGFWPHVTPSTTTPANALTLLEEAGVDVVEEVEILGVLRAASSRHGAGPFVTESPWLGRVIPDRHNGLNDWQGDFRLGWFDLLMARYASGVSGRVDGLVLTQLDRLCGISELKLCEGYRFEGPVASALSRYFVLESRGDEEVIVGIKVPAMADRAHQSGLSQMLRWCRPLYRRFQGWTEAQLQDWIAGRVDGPVESWLTALEGGLGLPIKWVSVGAMTTAMVERKAGARQVENALRSGLCADVRSMC